MDGQRMCLHFLAGILKEGHISVRLYGDYKIKNQFLEFYQSLFLYLSSKNEEEKRIQNMEKQVKTFRKTQEK